MFLSAAIFPVLLALSLVNAVPNSIERRADTVRLVRFRGVRNANTLD